MKINVTLACNFDSYKFHQGWLLADKKNAL